METVAIPWGALIALGGAVSSIVIALWAKIRSVEKDRDDKVKAKEEEVKEWTDRWAEEVKRNQEPPEWEEKTDIRHRREELLEQKRAADREAERREREEIQKREMERRQKQKQDEINALQRAYIDGDSTPPKLRRK